VRHFPPLPLPYADEIQTKIVAVAIGVKQTDVWLVFSSGDYLFDLAIWLFIIQIVDYLGFSIPQEFLTERIAIPAAHVVAFLIFIGLLFPLHRQVYAVAKNSGHQPAGWNVLPEISFYLAKIESLCHLGLILHSRSISVKKKFNQQIQFAPCR